VRMTRRTVLPWSAELLEQQSSRDTSCGDNPAVRASRTWLLRLDEVVAKRIWVVSE
jgi:hypothetical protein